MVPGEGRRSGFDSHAALGAPEPRPRVRFPGRHLSDVSNPSHLPLPAQTYAKRQIALRQIETALRLLEAQDDLISVVTLAGAAEEILGKLVKREGKTSALDSLSSAAHGMYEYLFGGEPLPPKHFIDRANLARNAFKHLIPTQATR